MTYLAALSKAPPRCFEFAVQYVIKVFLQTLVARRGALLVDLLPEVKIPESSSIKFLLRGSVPETLFCRTQLFPGSEPFSKMKNLGQCPFYHMIPKATTSRLNTDLSYYSAAPESNHRRASTSVVTSINSAEMYGMHNKSPRTSKSMLRTSISINCVIPVPVNLRHSFSRPL